MVGLAKKVIETAALTATSELLLGDEIKKTRNFLGRTWKRFILRKNTDQLAAEEAGTQAANAGKALKNFGKKYKLREVRALGENLKELGEAVKEGSVELASAQKAMKKAQNAMNAILNESQTAPIRRNQVPEPAGPAPSPASAQDHGSSEEKVGSSCFCFGRKRYASISIAFMDSQELNKSSYELTKNYLVEVVSTSVGGVVTILVSNNIVILCLVGVIGGVLYSALAIVYLKNQNQTIKLVARISRVFVSFGAPFGCFLMICNVFYNYITKKPLYHKWLCFSVFEKQVSFSKSPVFLEITSLAILQGYRIYKLLGFYTGIGTTGLFFLIRPNKSQFLVNAIIPIIISVFLYQAFFCWLSYTENEKLALDISRFDGENDFYFLLLKMFLGKNPLQLQQEMHKNQKGLLKNTSFFDFMRNIPCLETNCVSGVLNIHDDTFGLFL